MRNYNDDDVGPVILPTEGPIIVPLMVDELRPRRGALFDILASDFSSDCKAKYNQYMGKRKNNNHSTPHIIIPERSEQYRNLRREFLCFMLTYAAGGFLTLSVAFFMLVLPVVRSTKFLIYEPNKHASYTPTGEVMTDDYVAENAKESFKKFFFGDAGFD